MCINPIEYCWGCWCCCFSVYMHTYLCMCFFLFLFEFSCLWGTALCILFVYSVSLEFSISGSVPQSLSHYTLSLYELRLKCFTQKIESKERKREGDRASDNNVNNERYLYYFSLFFFQVLVHFGSFFFGQRNFALFLIVLIREGRRQCAALVLWSYVCPSHSF